MDFLIYGTILAIPVCAITYLLTLIMTKDKSRADRYSSLAYRYVLCGLFCLLIALIGVAFYAGTCFAAVSLVVDRLGADESLVPLIAVPLSAVTILVFCLVAFTDVLPRRKCTRDTPDVPN